MPLPQKRWFRLGELAQRWAVSPADIEDYALDEMLQLSVFVIDVPAEAQQPQSLEGEATLLEDPPVLNGPQPLLRASLLEIFRAGQAEVRAFCAGPPGGCLHVRRGAPPVLVRREDLIVARDERERFEREHGISSDAVAAQEAWHSADFRRVRLAGEDLSFGPKQAAVLRLLKEAGESDNPWRDGKVLLDQAGAATMRLIDLFKRKPEWRRLVLADGRGRYRLASELLSPERRGIRLFRRPARGAIHQNEGPPRRCAVRKALAPAAGTRAQGTAGEAREPGQERRTG